MPKLRVYQLARELNRDNAEIIRELQHMGVPVTSHSNTVEDRLADRLRRELGVFAPDGGQRAAADADDIVAVDTPDSRSAAGCRYRAKPRRLEPEPPHIEAKAEPKVEEKRRRRKTKIAAAPERRRHSPWRRPRRRLRRLRLLRRLRRKSNSLSQRSRRNRAAATRAAVDDAVREAESFHLQRVSDRLCRLMPPPPRSRTAA